MTRFATIIGKEQLIYSISFVLNKSTNRYPLTSRWGSLCDPCRLSGFEHPMTIVDPVQSLRDALDMEKAVSGSMKRMIDICSQVETL